MANDNAVLDPTEAEHDIELKREADEKKLHRMANVHDFLEMSQSSQNLRAIQRESRAQNNQMTAVGYISNTEGLLMHPGHTVTMMVQLHLNCREDHLSHQLFLQRTSLEGELKY
jgi:hypothetical protein